MKKIKLLCAAGLLGALAMTSCTDLTEKSIFRFSERQLLYG